MSEETPAPPFLPDPFAPAPAPPPPSVAPPEALVPVPPVLRFPLDPPTRV